MPRTLASVQPHSDALYSTMVFSVRLWPEVRRAGREVITEHFPPGANIRGILDAHWSVNNVKPSTRFLRELATQTASV